jgi:hypothetical protein
MAIPKREVPRSFALEVYTGAVFQFAETMMAVK